MKLDSAVVDTSALLAIFGVLPIEPPDVAQLYAPESSLVESIAVLRLPLVTGIADLAGLDADVATIVLPRRQS